MEKSPGTLQSVCLLPLSPSQTENMFIPWVLYVALISQLATELDIPSYSHLPSSPTLFHQSPAQVWWTSEHFSNKNAQSWNIFPLSFVASSVTREERWGPRVNPPSSPLFKDSRCSFICFKFWASAYNYFWTGTERIQNLPPYRMSLQRW